MNRLLIITRWIFRSVKLAASLCLSAFILVTGGYLLGWNTVSSTPVSVSTDSKPQSHGLAESGGFYSRPGSGTKSISTGGADSVDVEDIKHRILQLAARLRPGMNRYEQAAYAHAEVATMTMAEVQAGLKQLADAPQNRVFHELRMMMLDRWMTLDPESAYNYAREYVEMAPRLLRRESLDGIMLSIWASKDPEGAFKKWQSLPPDDRPTGYRLGTIFRSMGEVDFNLALGTGLSLPSENHYHLLRGLARSPDNDVERQQLFEKVAQLPDREQRDEIIAMSLHGWANDSGPEAVVKWLDTSNLPSVELNEIEDNLAMHWFYENHQAAADWLMSRADSPERRADALDRMARHWATYDPVAAGEWLIAQGLDASASRAMRNYADRIARNYPEDAVAWARAIPDKSIRAEALRRVHLTFSERYPREAAELFGKNTP